MRLVTLIFGVILICTSPHISAYTQATHMTFTEEAFKASELDDQAAPIYKLLPVSRTSTMEALMQGAFDEDDPGRRSACGHFFPSVSYFTLVGCLPTDSPDWILNGSGQIWIPFGFEEHSLRLANKYFYDALVSPNKDDRKLNSERLFKELGHVVHHIQDMAQPQHVRQEQHIDKFPVSLVNEGSLAYEIYSDLLKEQAKNVIRSPVFGKDAPFSFLYKTAHDFFRHLAGYTRNNFLSYHTNFQGLFGVCNSGKGYCSDFEWPFPSENNTHLSGATVKGRYPVDASDDQPISSVSSFVPFPFVNVPRYFTLTDENYEVQRKFLFERAVNYSAGFLNFYFRANIDATLSTSRTLIIKNKNAEALTGTFKLYYDDTATGNRTAWLNWSGTIAAAGEIDTGLFVPADQHDFIVVFSNVTTPGSSADELIAGVRVSTGSCVRSKVDGIADSAQLYCKYPSGRLKSIEQAYRLPGELSTTHYYLIRYEEEDMGDPTNTFPEAEWAHGFDQEGVSQRAKDKYVTSGKRYLLSGSYLIYRDLIYPGSETYYFTYGRREFDNPTGPEGIYTVYSGLDGASCWFTMQRFLASGSVSEQSTHFDSCPVTKSAVDAINSIRMFEDFTLYPYPKGK
jgi:hypothetical protein